MNVHTLKTWPEHFDAVKSGAKKFEVRKDDRGFRVGDLLVLLRQTANQPSGAYDPTTPALTARVTYILDGGEFGIDSTHVVMGIELVKEHQP